jgi:hypothetical protein
VTRSPAGASDVKQVRKHIADRVLVVGAGFVGARIAKELMALGASTPGFTGCARSPRVEDKLVGALRSGDLATLLGFTEGAPAQ